MLKYLIEKEFKQFFRNTVLPRIVLAMPIMMMLVFPWTANQEVKEIRLAVIDHDHSSFSRRLTDKAFASGYFIPVSYCSTFQGALNEIEQGNVDAVMELPNGFEKEYVTLGVGRVNVSSNAVDATKGTLAGAYLQSIIVEFSQELSAELSPQTEVGQSGLSVSTLFRFNARLDYKYFMIPALMVILLFLLCGYFPAMNIVGEKERGTIEQINVSPVSKFVFIAAKLIPYWLIGLFVMSLCFGLAYLIYGLLPLGSFFTIYVASILFILVVSGFGLVVSNYSDTIQQAMFVMFFFVLVFILISGLLTPIASMPDWTQVITTINPLKYFVTIMRSVYLRGSGIADLWVSFGALGVTAVVMVGWAIVSYRKNN